MFTYRDFEMGTLGLAWTGDLKNAGGVCEKNGVSKFEGKSILTDLKIGSTFLSFWLKEKEKKNSLSKSYNGKYNLSKLCSTIVAA